MPKSVLEIWICNAPLVDGQGKGMWQLWELLWQVCSFNCGISWVVLGGLYFEDCIWGLAVGEIRFHRTAATQDHKEDIKTTSALLSANMPIIECRSNIKLTCIIFSFCEQIICFVRFNLKIVHREFATLLTGLNSVLLDLFVLRCGCLSLQYSNSDPILIYCLLSLCCCNDFQTW